MMQNRSFEWKGRQILLAGVSSVLEFESCPEVVDFARLCCCVLLLGQWLLPLKQSAAQIRARASKKPFKRPNYMKGTHRLVKSNGGNCIRW